MQTRLLNVPVVSLTKEIWQAGTRGVRIDSVWTGYCKKVISQSAFLAPRDVSMILEAFGKIKFRDDQMLSHLVPTIIKYMDEFSVREIVSILSSMKKLEFSRLDCVYLFVNQLVLRKSEWNAMDCALIANCISWFRVFDEKIWKIIEKNVAKNWQFLEPIGISLLVGALARLDIRNERILDKLTRAVLQSDSGWSQETLAVLVNGFAKLRWDRAGLFDNTLVPRLASLLAETPQPFDQQSLVLLLHAFCGYRFNENREMELIQKLIAALPSKLNVDQIAKLRIVSAVLDQPLNGLAEKEARTCRIKLPRWEYEVFRILKDSVGAQVYRKNNQDGKTSVYIRPKNNDTREVCVLCLGPFQYYANSTKRTAASLLNEHVTRRTKDAMTIPYFVWNELKTDNDKLMYLLSLGREAVNLDNKI